LYNSGAIVTLTPSPAAGYSFSSWSGACTGTGACSVTMDQARSVKANFISCAAQVGSTCYPTMGTAGTVAPGGSTVKAQGIVLNESLNANTGASIHLDGGYDTEFDAKPGNTTLQQLTVTSGTVSVSNIVIQ